jgi:hypothetical protein
MAQTDPITPEAKTDPAKKPDLITLPGLAILVACVVAGLGNSRGSAVLTWQVPLALVALALAFAGWRALSARR